MASKSTYREKDNGASRILAGVKERAVVDVGVIGPKADQKSGSATIRQIATWNHEGTLDQGGRTPPRPFVSGWFDSAQDDMNTFVRAATLKLLQGKITAQQFVRLVGEKGVGGIKKYMTTNVPPDNAESTKLKKTKGKGGKTTTLIDKGLMRSAVSYREGRKK